MMETKKKEIFQEVQLLINLVEKHKSIIENKKTDAVTNKDKETAWRYIETSFNACGVSTNARTWKTLKLKYESLKKNTKKKSSLHRQEMYRTGGGPSNALDFNDIEEKVMSICSNIKGLEARHDSDTLPNMNKPKISEKNLVQDNDNNNDSQKENKWDKWQPNALKTRVSNVLRTNATKSSVTAKLDTLSEARLELVKLQIETASKQQQHQEEEHKMKMLHMANDERRKEEIHTLILQKISCGVFPNGMI